MNQSDVERLADALEEAREHPGYHGMTMADLVRLTGLPEAELRASAQRMLAEFSPSPGLRA